MTNYKFKNQDEAIACTDSKYYMLFEGGYIKPKDLLENSADILEVENAMEIIEKFLDEAEEEGIIDTDC